MVESKIETVLYEAASEVVHVGIGVEVCEERKKSQLGRKRYGHYALGRYLPFSNEMHGSLGVSGSSESEVD